MRRYLPRKAQLVINDNRSTLLSVSGSRFSVHRMFVDAPEEILEELGRYFKGRQTRPILRHFIQNQKVLPRTLHLDPKGEIYDLQEMYDEINLNYFNNELKLQIGWFGKPRMRCRHITFGQYVEDARAVKIHRLLDDPFFPRFFVALVVYHEMLHSVIPGYLDERGLFRIHGPEFKRREREFHAYTRARRWEKANKEKIFGWT